MENNEEHKLDSFFKKSLENQAFPPPENLWSSIATETIGKETAGITPLLKYTILSLGLIIIAGIAFWFLTDNEAMKENRQEIASLGKVVNATQPLANSKDEKAVIKSVENEVKAEKNDTGNSTSNLVSFVNHVEKESVKPTVYRKPTTHKKLYSINGDGDKTNNPTHPTSVEIDNNNTAILTVNNEVANNFLNLISHKDLKLNDLSTKNNKNLVGKIRPIQPLINEEADKHESKSEDTGSKFSLKHPIFSFDYGKLWNEWTLKSDKSMIGTIMYPDKGTAYNLKAGVAWKLTKKSRMGISLAYNTYDVGAPYIYLPIWSSLWVSPKLNLTTKNGTQYYSAVFPTGTVNIPVNRLDGFITKVPNTLDSTRDVFLHENHTIKTYSLAITTQNDLISLQSKKKKYINFQLYTIADFVFQRQTSYTYIANDALMMVSSSLAVNEKARISYTTGHLENASDFIFGIRAGLGIRWQFAPRLGLHIEGSTQNSFNSWVQNQEVKSYLKSTGLQAGINLSL